MSDDGRHRVSIEYRAGSLHRLKVDGHVLWASEVQVIDKAGQRTSLVVTIPAVVLEAHQEVEEFDGWVKPPEDSPA